MAGAKEVKTKIKSVQNTQKITKAMEMVAASKMRRAQDRVVAARPYAEKIERTASHVVQASIGRHHPFQVARDVKRVGIIVISTDRGLCGGLNINLFRRALAEIRKWEDQGAAVDLVTLGRKGNAFFRRFAEIKANVVDLGDKPQIKDLIGTVKVMLDAYRKENIDRLFVMGNQFVNTMTQRPYSQQLLPVEVEEDDGLANRWDYIYEPEDSSLVDNVLMRFVEAQVYRGVVENVACEMAARMVAMKSASDNAGDIIGELQLEYNKQRQAAITQELSEIVAGAAAVS